MLDDGKAQAGAAQLLGVALVHPIKPLEHPALLPFGDADAGVTYLHGRSALPGKDGDRHGAAGLVVLDGVVAQVVKDLLHDLIDSPEGLGLAGDRHRHLPPAGGLFQIGAGLPAQLQQVDVLGLLMDLLVLQPGQADDVVHQHDEALGLPIDGAGEPGHILLLHQAVLDQLGIARNGGQRGFQLMGYVGGELPAHGVLPEVLHLQLVHLLLQKAVLAPDALHQGAQLFIDLPVVGVLQVDPAQGAGDLPGKPGRQQKGQGQRQHQHRQNGGEQLQHQLGQSVQVGNAAVNGPQGKGHPHQKDRHGRQKDVLEDLVPQRPSPPIL